MPVFEFLQWTQQAGGTLTSDGPIVPVEVSMPAALEEWFVRRNLPIPPPISGYALIDTGAGISGVHEPILEQLSILPIDSIQLSTASGTDRGFIYPTRLAFPALNTDGYQARVVGNQLNWTTSDGKNVIMLLGRDILATCLLIYHPRVNSVTLAF